MPYLMLLKIINTRRGLRKMAFDRAVDMTSGNPTRLILRLAVPLMLTNIGQQLYGIADAIIVGRGVGVAAFAALGACDWLVWLVLWSVQGLTQGFSTLVSRNFGAHENKKLHQAVAMCAWLCLMIGIAVTVVFTLLSRPLLLLIGTPGDIIGDAVTYLSMIYLGTLIVLGYNMSAAILRAVGDGKTPLIAMGIAGGLNVGLDLLFVMVFKWGIIGAASATLLAQLIAFLYCLAVIKKSPVFKSEKESRKWNGKMAKELCSLGFPMCVSAIVVDIGGIMAQSVINSFGTIFVAGCTAANKLHGTLDCSAVAIGFASSTYIGQNYGARRMDRVRDGIRKATIIAVAIGGAIMLAMFAFGKPIVGMFLSKDVANASEALEIGYQYVMVMSAMLIAAYLMNLYRYSLQGLGNTIAPMLSGFFEFGARIFVAFVFPLFLGRFGLFFMDGSAWVAAGIFQIICFFITLRKKEKHI